jgi:hypothetical protein
MHIDVITAAIQDIKSHNLSIHLTASRQVISALKLMRSFHFENKYIKIIHGTVKEKEK